MDSGIYILLSSVYYTTSYSVAPEIVNKKQLGFVQEMSTGLPHEQSINEAHLGLFFRCWLGKALLQFGDSRFVF
jgi:hypothetical protein